MWITIITLVVLFFLIPIRVEIDSKKDANIKIYIYYYIKIFEKNFNEEQIKIVEKKGLNLSVKVYKQFLANIKFSDILFLFRKVKIILKKIKINKFYMDLQINPKVFFENYIITSYIVCLINSLVSMILCNNSNNVNFNNTKYYIGMTSNKQKFEISCIISYSLVNIIYILFKTLIYILKLRKRGYKNGRASNRKFNVNSNVFSRNNG